MTSQDEPVCRKQEAQHRALFWDTSDEVYEQIAADPELWAEIQAERAGQAPSIKDGLADEAPQTNSTCETGE